MLSIYRMMNLIRKFEEQALRLFEANKLRGSVHLCIGQEAPPAAVCALLKPDDYIASTHRATATAWRRAPIRATRWPS
jgi:pyruvate dehydrogenase E1 component alpha subunit